MSEQYKAALARAVMGALISAALVVFTTLQVTDYADPHRMETADTRLGWRLVNPAMRLPSELEASAQRETLALFILWMGSRWVALTI